MHELQGEEISAQFPLDETYIAESTVTVIHAVEGMVPVRLQFQTSHRILFQRQLVRRLLRLTRSRHLPLGIDLGRWFDPDATDGGG